MTGLEAELRLEDTDYKNTQKLTWLAETGRAPFTPTVCVHFEHLITKGILKPDEDFKDFVNKKSKVSYILLNPRQVIEILLRFLMRCLGTHRYGN